MILRHPAVPTRSIAPGRVGPVRVVRALATAAAGIVLAACARAPRAAGRPAPATVTPAATATTVRSSFDEGLRIAERFRVDAIATRRFTHRDLWRAVAPSLASTALRTSEIGRSVQGRELRSVTFGEGRTTVLLWSQMHGNESTATMAMADILRFLADAESDPLRERLRRELTITFVPMLNPDGAERFQRGNAAGVDVNRDARQLATPEARALATLHERLRPRFGFNLHDQSARVRAGRTGPQTAIALLAPPYSPDRRYNDVRSRARLVASTIAAVLASELPGRVARYDDTFNARAFGDLLQQRGTSTVLIETGALRDDPEKQHLRALNVAAILHALDAIATGGYAAASPALYDALPLNTSVAVDLLIAGGRLVVPGQPTARVDVAVNFDDPVARTGGRVHQVGTLRGVVAIDTLDATGLFLHPAASALARGPNGTSLRVGAPADIELRRGAAATSQMVRRIGAATHR
jgi:predicted deacylase